MRATTLLGAAALALLVSSSLAPIARAGDESGTAQALRERISADVAAKLPHSTAPAAPHSLRSKPAVLPGAHAATSAPAPVHGDAAVVSESAPADSTPEGVWSDLVAGNRRFVSEHPRVRPYIRERDELTHGQHPRAILLACSDSRVSPELVFDQTLGDVFVVRTAGNIVDPIALGSIEYAVEHLHAHLLVVVGHSSCGAVKASVAGGEMPSTYLQAITDRIHPIVARLSNCFEGDELVERSVIANARQSATDMVANSALLREAVAKGELRVMSAVYDLKSGVVTSVTPASPAPTATAAVPVPGH